jgi:hypothetical protein
MFATQSTTAANHAWIQTATTAASTPPFPPVSSATTAMGTSRLAMMASVLEQIPPLDGSHSELIGHIHFKQILEYQIGAT